MFVHNNIRLVHVVAPHSFIAVRCGLWNKLWRTSTDRMNEAVKKLTVWR